MTFIHQPFEYTELTSESESGSRHYVLPDGTKVPSVTTILGELSKKSIMEWRKRVGEEEANKISSKASRRGTAIHKICENYLLNDPDYKDGVMPIHLETFRKLQPYLDKNIGTIYGLEIPLYSKILMTAGRTDCIAEYKGKMSIVDFKTSLKPKKEEWITNYFIQASAYALMAQSMFKIDIPQIVIMIAVDNEDPQIFTKKKDKYIPLVRQVFVTDRKGKI